MTTKVMIGTTVAFAFGMAVNQANAASGGAVQPPGRVVAPADDAPITRETVEGRYRRGRELARAGDVAAALEEFLWCFDRGMPSVSGYGGVRLSFLLGEISRLGDKGLDALAARRDRAEEELLAGPSFEAAADFAALNRTLKEPERTMAVYDRLPAGDPRRQKMAIVVTEQLLEARRYKEIADVQPALAMTRMFEVSTVERPLPRNIKDPAAMRKQQRAHAIKTAAKNIEVLAGAGNLTDARSFAEKVLAFDSSPETRALLNEHLARAGQPALLTAEK